MLRARSMFLYQCSIAISWVSDVQNQQNCAQHPAWGTPQTKGTADDRETLQRIKLWCLTPARPRTTWQMLDKLWFLSVGWDAATVRAAASLASATNYCFRSDRNDLVAIYAGTQVITVTTLAASTTIDAGTQVDCVSLLNLTASTVSTKTRTATRSCGTRKRAIISVSSTFSDNVDM